MVFTSPPSMMMACKQLVEYGDNFKDCLHKPTFHEVACMRQRRQTISRMVFTSPPSMRMACKQLAVFGDNFKDCLHKLIFHEDGLHAQAAILSGKGGQAL